MGTPTELHSLGGVPLWVKRDDLYALPPAPPLAKIRGVKCHLERHWDEVRQTKFVGVFDTRVSKAGWGTAWVCRELLLACTVYYPELKAENGQLREYQQRAQRLHADMQPLPGGRTAVLYGQAKKLCQTAGGYMLPLGLVVPEAVDAAAEEMRATLAETYFRTLVVSVGTGTILSGLLLGLADAAAPVAVYGITAGMDPARIRQRMARLLADAPEATYPRLWLEKAGDYYVPAEGEAPFPCHPYYDLKAWRWLERRIRDNKMKQPVLFWNIGA